MNAPDYESALPGLRTALYTLTHSVIALHSAAIDARAYPVARACLHLVNVALAAVPCTQATGPELVRALTGSGLACNRQYIALVNLLTAHGTEPVAAPLAAESRQVAACYQDFATTYNAVTVQCHTAAAVEIAAILWN